MGTTPAKRKSGTVAALVTALAGWLLLLPLHTPNPLVRWSYDLLQPLLPADTSSDIAIIYMDEQAMQDYRITPGQPWPRSLYARLLNRLTQDRPKVVVFDVTMTQAGDPAEDAALAAAIRANGRVVLAGDKVPVQGVSVGYTIVPPLESLETNAAAWGTAKVLTDPDRVGRRNLSGDSQEPGLAWAAASVAGARVARDESRRLGEERWLNYYGSGRPFADVSMTYTNAELSEPGFFRDKAVFIGGKPETLLRGEITDVFGTPFTKWNGEFVPGVELTAVAYANLVREDWLRRMSLLTDLTLLLIAGVVFGMGFHAVRLRVAIWPALLVVSLVAGGAVALLLSSRLWFPWAIVCLAQLPCAFLFRLASENKTALRAGETSEPSPAVGAETVIADGRPEIPDHEMIRCIGEGAYGQVWLARNAIGLFHAVKVVYRSRFGVAEPYDRALRGIQKFMPVSRSHEGFVHILHVGRNDRAGYFFYIMEAGDDQKTGQQIESASYAAKTLGSEIRVRGTIPPRECLNHLLAITEAVERLHQQHLIHRDIKPDNILFVNQRPKLADIDLVTDLSASGKVSLIGTEGYMAPEGPGTAAADVFSLGRVLYVAITGKPAVQCPELPTNVTSHPDCALFFELNQIVCKACEFDLERRYSTAAEMRSALLEVLQRLPK
jgi:CHASE2 domain-containing sensor protein